MTTINTEFANNLGRQFAAELNSDPKEAQNWNTLDSNSDIPDGDWSALSSHYGDDADERAVQDAYRAGFNAVFVHIGKGA